MIAPLLNMQSKVIHLIFLIHQPYFGDSMPSSNQGRITNNYNIVCVIMKINGT